MNFPAVIVNSFWDLIINKNKILLSVGFNSYQNESYAARFMHLL